VQISGSVVLVTGANRGIGAEFVQQLRDRGAAKIYAAARDAGTVVEADGIEPLRLDVTSQDQVDAAAARATDVQILVNNASILRVQPLVGGDLGEIRREFETNVFGPLRMSRAFAPLLAANGGGAILNVLSLTSWLAVAGQTSYCATKAAAWSLTEGLRLELADQGTEVVGLHMGPVDTDMGGQVESGLHKLSPAEVVSAALDGIEAGAIEVLADDLTREVKRRVAGDPADRYAVLAG
jgi:NAD(P)-dependent dehydrogenase (short-subunit alcohol dehydrogenase family)